MRLCMSKWLSVNKQDGDAKCQQAVVGDSGLQIAQPPRAEAVKKPNV